MKRCTVCGADKPLGAYYRRASRADGYNTRCKTCCDSRGHSVIPASRPKRCVACGVPIPAERSRGGLSHSTCSHACLLASVGLPPGFDPAMLGGSRNTDGDWITLQLSPETEAEIRSLLRAVMDKAATGSERGTVRASPSRNRQR